jgi:hypothetical protein
MTTEALVTAALSAASALIAAWVGTQLGLRKFRQERSFDARLEWHRRLAETAKVLRNRVRAFHAFQRGGTPEDVPLSLVKDIGQLSFQFQELTESASLYATRRTLTAIQNVLADMTESAQPFSQYPSDDADHDAMQRSAGEMYKRSLAGMERVYDLLARDLREMLGLERLKEHESLDSNS